MLKYNYANILTQKSIILWAMTTQMACINFHIFSEMALLFVQIANEIYIYL